MASDLSLSISVSAVVGGALSGLTNIGKAMNTLKSTTTNLTAKQKELGESLERNKDRLSSTSAAHLWRQYNQVGEAIDNLTRKHEQLAKISARRIGNQEQWQNLKGQWQNAASAAGALILPVKLAIDFESAMADVKKVVDFETPEQFKQMGNDIVAMSRKIPMSTTELAKIVALGGQSGIAQNDLMRFTESAAKMGVAFDISAERAGQSMAELRSAFKLDQKGVETLADKINYLGNTTPAAAKGIMEIVQRVGAFGTVAGYNTGTVAALGATMRGFGIQEEMAATSIKNMMLALVAGETATKSQKAAWKELGQPAPELLDWIRRELSGEKKRPLCDTVVVNAPETVDYTLQAELVLYTGANAVEVKAAAEQAWAVYENQRRLKLGGDIVPLDVMSVLKVAGVYNVVLTQPNWKIIKPNQWARCTAVKLTTSTERQDG